VILRVERDQSILSISIQPIIILKTHSIMAGKKKNMDVWNEFEFLHPPGHKGKAKAVYNRIIACDFRKLWSFYILAITYGAKNYP
jgi:hypothetical protein